MNKKSIKTFAMNARNKLREDVAYQMNLIGINENNILNPSQKDSEREIYDIGSSYPKILYKKEIQQRKNLIIAIEEKGYDNVVEEVAYTWFNRIIAIRFMEVNNYLPMKIRILSSETENKLEPDIITEAPNIGLDFDGKEIETIYSLKNENKLDELFQFLFIKQCNELNSILPELFEKTKDYFELLLSISFTKEEGIVRQLIKLISEEDFKDQVEIIGWLYQYYNAELKDETFAQLKKRVKITKERIPAATQLFTPDWIVKYMVENSLGRLWVETHPDDEIKKNWEYYIDEAEQKPEVQKQLKSIEKENENINIEDIKVIDPCMGSGHVLIYFFDVLMQIYLSQGYNKKDASICILKNNLFGLDIDDRAYQLAYFAVFMKARAFHRQIFKENIELNLASIQESNDISPDLIDYLSKENHDLKRNLKYVREVFIDAKYFGSLLDVKNVDFKILKNKLTTLSQSSLIEIGFFDEIKIKINPLLKQADILSQKYEIVVTNPPYMGNSGMSSKLSNYLKKNFVDSKRDLFSVFMEKCDSITRENGFYSMITQQSFMFLSSYEKLREKILKNTIINMVHLGARAFEEIGGEVVQTTAFSIRKTNLKEYLSSFIRVTDKNSQKLKETSFLKRENIFITAIDKVSAIPGNPIAYWAGPQLINAFKNGKNFSSFALARQGLSTGDNNRFLKMWYEVDICKVGFGMTDATHAMNSGKKWFPYNKGGNYRKWYGNQEYLINYEKDGKELKEYAKSKYNSVTRTIKSISCYFKESLSWSKISSGNIAFRFFQSGFLFDVAGCSIFTDEDKMYLLGFLNSQVCSKILGLISPTLNYEVGHISSLPIIYSENSVDIVRDIVKENIKLSKMDWDSFETSWNFEKHPFLQQNEKFLSNAFEKWNNHCESIYYQLMENEKKLNEIFIEIYGLNKNSIVEMDGSDTSLRIAEIERDIKSLFSYFTGCMFGRYSLDQEGLVYAGGDYNPSKYSKFLPDEDNIVPISDTEFFEDDILSKFTEFLKVTFSEETLEENIKFIANALGNKGKTYRETIRKYFLKDFFKDHKRMFKKTPIYWQFDSGKEDGFKALIYMHRYTPDTVARVRIDYLHPLQKAFEEQINHNEQVIINSTNSNEKFQATKENIKLKKQLEETRKYDKALGHVANQQIEIDLDDGVKHNYELFQNVEVENKKINLLKKL
ncbi:MAG: BREX-1 system adenine-specific DNA-methyltransferase PglX [Methanobrevibacter sp.]|nr:BREX-1 system adenine-specific DNA-methyltransferase PglX [Methanobrevibacter sp.]